MEKVSRKLIVFFEEPFWVGVFDHVLDESLSVCKVTFGAEPQDYEPRTTRSRETAEV